MGSQRWRGCIFERHWILLHRKDSHPASRRLKSTWRILTLTDRFPSSDTCFSCSHRYLYDVGYTFIAFVHQRGRWLFLCHPKAIVGEIRDVGGWGHGYSESLGSNLVTNHYAPLHIIDSSPSFTHPYLELCPPRKENDTLLPIRIFFNDPHGSVHHVFTVSNCTAYS